MRARRSASGSNRARAASGPELVDVGPSADPGKRSSFTSTPPMRGRFGELAFQLRDALQAEVGTDYRACMLLGIVAMSSIASTEAACCDASSLSALPVRHHSEDGAGAVTARRSPQPRA